MKKRNKEFKLHPALLFLVLTFVIMIVSSIGGLLNIETSYYTVNSNTGNLESKVVLINNLFNRTGLQNLVSNMLSNFINFAPLGNLIIGLLGVGVAYKSGYLVSLFKILSKKISRKTFTFLVVFLGIISSMFFPVGYVILIPIAAILFITLGRHPSAGICAAFAGITFGYGANIVVNGLDSMLIDYTSSASSILDSVYKVNINGNIYFMIISTILLAYLGMIITERYVIPKLGRYNFTEEETIEINNEVTTKEKKGVSIALLTSLLIALILIYTIIPGLPFSGLFLYLKDSLYVDQLFGDNSYFNQGVTVIFSALLIVAGLVYGFRVKTIRNNRDLVDGMSYYIKDVASILVLIFFASQFCAIFKETNIGVFVVSSLTEIINSIEVSGLVLVILTFLVTIICTLFVPSAVTKWAIMSPIIVPMFMQSSMTPEFAQAVFRAGDSAVKGITPLFSYFVILIGFLQIYNKKKDVVSLTDTLGIILPYALIYSILWFIIILAFYIIGLPIGVGTGVML